MANEILMFILVFLLISIGVGGTWVGYYFDKRESRAQEKPSDMMGENEASYGLKSTLKNQELSDDEDLNNLQGDIADTAGGMLGKGGIGEGVGSGLAKV